MKKLSLIVLIVFAGFVVVGCGKKPSLEGKVVDAKNNPIANLKIIAEQVQPIKGYERFETMTGSDGSFRFKMLFPSSEYVLTVWSDEWFSTVSKKIQSEPDGQTALLDSPLKIRFMRRKEKEGVISDTKTGLMWGGTDNGEDIDWHASKEYCEKYSGGGFNDWRLPTRLELKALTSDCTDIKHIVAWCTGGDEHQLWADVQPGAGDAGIFFDVYNQTSHPGARTATRHMRVVPVRTCN